MPPGKSSASPPVAPKTDHRTDYRLHLCANADEILAKKQIGDFDLQRCQEIGATLAAGLALGILLEKLHR
jgi:hypothetical protein